MVSFVITDIRLPKVLFNAVKIWASSRPDNEMASQHVSRNYELFDPWAYLDDLYGEVDRFHHHSLKHIHKFYKSCGSPAAGLKVLEFGAGPVIAYVISASLYASEIVLSVTSTKIPQLNQPTVAHMMSYLQVFA